MRGIDWLGRNVFRTALVFGICFVVVAYAHADSINTFDFSASLANNNGSVAGNFTLNKTSGTITSFDIKTPVMELNSTNFSQTGAFVFSFTPAISPSIDLVIFEFLDVFRDHVILVFAADLPTFDGSGFLTTPVTIPTGTGSSEVVCAGSGSPLCSVGGFQSSFASGAATRVPEPATLALFVSGLLGLGCKKLLR
jgi:PEP-CTERM motif